MNNKIEKKLLENTDIDKLIEQKIQGEIENEFKKLHSAKKKTVIRDFSDIEESKIFDKKTIYRVLNRKMLTESYINGIQAESLIGLNQSIRDNLKNKYSDNFTVYEYYVKFHSRCEMA